MHLHEFLPDEASRFNKTEAIPIDAFVASAAAFAGTYPALQSQFPANEASAADREDPISGARERMNSKRPDYVYPSHHNDFRKLGSFDFDQLAAYLDSRPSKQNSQHYLNQSRIVHDAAHFFWSEPTGTVTATKFDEFDFRSVCKNTKTLLESSIFWFNFCSPTSEEMDNISRAFGLHPLTNEDIQTSDTRQKVEVFENYYFVVQRL